ncbi:MAG: hypothetical protein QM758_07255 [Armatimonas sp.]
MGRLKRFAIGTGATIIALGGLTTIWYREHYIVPPLPEVKVTLPSPNGFDTLQEAAKLEVPAMGRIYVSPRPLNEGESPLRYPVQSLMGRQKLLEANQPAIAKIREALGQECMVPASIHMDTESSSRRSSESWHAC